MLTIEERKNDKIIIVMNRLLKRITAIMLTMAMVCMIGCKKTDDPDNGGNNGNNGGNGGEIPEAPAIVSTSEVQYDGTVFIEAVFEDGSKMYFAITSPTEAEVVSGEFFCQDNPSLAYKYRGEVVIPEILNHIGSNYIVTAIGHKAFCNCDLVTSVTIPNSVKYIYSYQNYTYPYGNTYGTFQGCNNLTNINISDNIQHIGEKAFVGCPCFSETVIIPKGVKSIGIKAFNSNNVVFNADSCFCAGGLVYPEDPTGQPTCYSAFPNMNSISFGDNVKVLPAYLFSDMNPTIIDISSSVTVLSNEVFRGCTNLERVNNLESVLKIGEMAFYKCESLNSVTLNNTLTHFGYRTFYGCRNLTSIEIPNSIVTVGHGVFEGSGLRDISWGNSIDTIGRSAFRCCSDLSEVVIPHTVTIIDDDAFEMCSSLTSVTIGNAVTSIGSRSFYSCEELSSVSFGNSVTSIGAAAFGNSRKLTEINLPSSIKTINNMAFEGGFALTNITCAAIEPPILGERVFESRWIQAIYVPISSVELYKMADGWSEYADKIIGI